MSRVPLPLSNDWKTWGRQLVRQLSIALDNLRWKTDEDVPAQNGSVLWDETLKDAVVSVDGEWRPLSMDFDVYLAEQEIFNTYGDRVSVAEKKKTLLKFGRNGDLDATDGFATVWTLGQYAGTENEVFAPEGTNPIDCIISSDAGDTDVITVEGHTSDGNTGADENFTFVIQTVTLNGQTKVNLTTPLARVSRMAVEVGGTPAGRITVFEDSAVSGGIPTDITKAHAEIEAGNTQSFKGATTFSSQDYFILTQASFSIRKSSGSGAAVDFRLEVRNVGGVFRPRIGEFSLGGSGAATLQEIIKPHVIIPKNSDVRIIANTDTNNTIVGGQFSGYLAKIVT